MLHWTRQFPKLVATGGKIKLVLLGWRARFVWRRSLAGAHRVRLCRAGLACCRPTNYRIRVHLCNFSPCNLVAAAARPTPLRVATVISNGAFGCALVHVCNLLVALCHMRAPVEETPQGARAHTHTHNWSLELSSLECTGPMSSLEALAVA